MKHKRLVVMYRESLLEKGELDAIKETFEHSTQTRMVVQPGDLVIGRCCMVPFYKDVAFDIEFAGGKPINSYKEHLYVADLKNYVEDLKELTPQTWDDLSKVPRDAGPFVLKGETNSMKRAWSTHMFAKDWDAAGQVYSRLSQDGLVGDQTIYIRKYVPLIYYGDSIGGCPISKEYRCFVYKGVLISAGFYWHAFQDDVIEQGYAIPDITEIPEAFMDEVIDRVAGKIPFFVVDVAQGVDGKWWVIELNDGQQSGLSANDPRKLYTNLKWCLENE